jgi:hypothetical protein
VPATVKVASPKPAPYSAKIQAEAVESRGAADDRVNQASWSITSATAEARARCGHGPDQVRLSPSTTRPRRGAGYAELTARMPGWRGAR